MVIYTEIRKFKMCFLENNAFITRNLLKKITHIQGACLSLSTTPLHTMHILCFNIKFEKKNISN